MTYPLQTLAAQITSAGISAPVFNDIFSSLVASAQGIFGSDIVLDNSSQDLQLLATVAYAIDDANQTLINDYNDHRPDFAQGAGQDSLFLINGIRRLVSSASTAPIECVGPAGTEISSGVVSDGTYKWDLPALVTIPVGGSIIATATCETQGSITAPAGTINQIVNPQKGWQSAVSTADAAPGAPVESDATFRNRRTVSTAISSVSLMAGIVAALMNLPGVTSVESYENDTGSVDANGAPPSSIYFVVEGGDAQTIAQTIALKKAPGVRTYGTTNEVVVDPNTGVPVTINFFIPSLVPINLTITLTPLSGYVSTTGTLIQTQESTYLSSLGIGGADGFIFNSKLYSPANDTGTLANSYNVTGILASRGAGVSPTANADLAIAFNEIPTAGTITVNVT